MGKTVIDEIEKARKTLGLTDAQLRLLSDAEGLAVYEVAEAHFVKIKGQLWWWDSFRLPFTRVSFQDGAAFTRLTRIVPSPTEKVWFITEEDQLPCFPVYETDTATVEKILGECYNYEYYVIAKDMSWLICENHHDVLFVIGLNIPALTGL